MNLTDERKKELIDRKNLLAERYNILFDEFADASLIIKEELKKIDKELGIECPKWVRNKHVPNVQ